MIRSLDAIRTIGICGAGLFGTAVGVCFKRAGYRVLVWNHRPERLATLGARVHEMESFLDENIGLPTRLGGVIEPHNQLSVVDERADLVLDGIVENLDEKVNLFWQLRGCVERGALFLTTTSGLSITEMGRRSGCGHLLAGMHFWNPAHLMPLVEVIRGEETAEYIMDLACQVAKSIGKLPVRANRDVPGFIGNRLLHALWREAIHIVEQGIASPQDVDLVARMTFGLRLPVMGPLENMDLVGLDLIETIMAYLLADLADNHRPSERLTSLVQQNHLGIKSGRGFYDWSTRSAEELHRRRNQQIVHQLNYLKELDRQHHG
jgi:3-hydroxybutyryl-CoA dehydrogenase